MSLLPSFGIEAEEPENVEKPFDEMTKSELVQAALQREYVAAEYSATQLNKMSKDDILALLVDEEEEEDE
jgi:hypothetical protein